MRQGGAISSLSTLLCEYLLVSLSVSWDSGRTFFHYFLVYQVDSFMAKFACTWRHVWLTSKVEVKKNSQKKDLPVITIQIWRCHLQWRILVTTAMSQRISPTLPFLPTHLVWSHWATDTFAQDQMPGQMLEPGLYYLMRSWFWFWNNSVTLTCLA